MRAAAVTVQGYPAATQRDLPGKAQRLGPIAAHAIGRDRELHPGGKPFARAPSWAFCITTALLCLTLRPPRVVLFRVRTRDERIAPESLTCRKSLFVHHNIWIGKTTRPQKL